MELFIAVLASLFSVVNPFGAVPMFIGMTPHHTVAERRKTALNTSIYFALILMSFFLAGTYILGFFGVSLNAMRIAGGLVILASGYSLLEGKFAEGRAINKAVTDEALNKEDISFSPLAMPMLSGPGSISLLIGFNAQYPDLSNQLIIASVILTTAVIVYFILRWSPFLFKLLGIGGIKAMTRIMGFLVMAIGIQYIIVGVVDLVKVLT